MKNTTRWILAALIAAQAAPLFAQSSSGSENAKSDKKEAVAHPGGDKRAIEKYLQGRLNKIQKMHNGQESFGRKVNGAWQSYWSKVFEDRKRFEVRVARNRLDLFESLGSLDAASHGSAIVDYERLQTNLWRSFEDKQKDEMAQFFGKMLADIKEFSTEQEKARQDLMTEAGDAWQAQKSTAK